MNDEPNVTLWNGRLVARACEIKKCDARSLWLAAAGFREFNPRYLYPCRFSLTKQSILSIRFVQDFKSSKRDRVCDQVCLKALSD